MSEEARLHEFVGKMVGDLGAAANGALVLIGDKLGLFRALAEGGPTTASRLARQTGTSERYIREWLAAQAASGYVEYDPEAGTFSMTPEQVAVFADEESPVLMTGGFHSIASLFNDEEKIAAAFRSGDGIPWGDHHHGLYTGTERFFRPSYRANLISSWIPALEGVQEKLVRGALVADVGSGHGVSTRILAAAFPASRFIGFDSHRSSVEHANEAARSEGLENVTFEVASAKDFPGTGYDLVTFFDCLHDMGDPAGAAAHVLGSLEANGTWMVVEPRAGDDLAENLNPVGRVYYAFSATVCTPSSLSQEVGAALGAQAGEARLRQVITTGGFTRFRRAAETPFNLVLEVRP